MSRYKQPGYRQPKKSKYLKIEKGENVFRIVAPQIIGWEDWTADKKPLRFRNDDCPKKPVVPGNTIKNFWALWTWDVLKEELGILEITQSSLLNALRDLIDDPKYGDLDGFDIKVFRSGEGKQTQYMVVPGKKSPLSEEIKEAMQKNPVRLEALYDGGDPWKDLDGAEDSEFPSESSPLGAPFDTLKEHLEIDGIDTSHLQEFLDVQSKRNNDAPINDVIESALHPDRLRNFKKAYVKSLLPSAGAA